MGKSTGGRFLALRRPRWAAAPRCAAALPLAHLAVNRMRDVLLRGHAFDYVRQWWLLRVPDALQMLKIPRGGMATLGAATAAQRARMLWALSKHLHTHLHKFS